MRVGDHGALRQLPVLVPPSAIQEEFSKTIEDRAFEIEQAKCLQDPLHSMSHQAFSKEL